MLKELEMYHLEDMNEDLELALECFIMSEKCPEKEGRDILCEFIEYVKKENLKAIDEPRKDGKTYRTWAIDQDKLKKFVEENNGIR